jgi:hypothetical protein
MNGDETVGTCRLHGETIYTYIYMYVYMYIYIYNGRRLMTEPMSVVLKCVFTL